MIWIIGSGYMAKEYCRVLQHLNVPFLVIGRSEQSAVEFSKEMGIKAISGGIKKFMTSNSVVASHAIVCTSVDSLSSVAIELLQIGVKNILLEKPGALNIAELDAIDSYAKTLDAKVYIGYNRRFYQSTLTVEKMIQEDGPLIAVNFEITEWPHHIQDSPSNKIVKEHLMLANTSHVIDLAFFIAGFPEQLSTYSTGCLDWHPSGARFVGAGVTQRGAVLSYHGYWDGPGRWSVEFVTQKRKMILRPMERLSIQQTASLEVVNTQDIDYSLDEQFKPGLYLQTQAFLDANYSRLVSIPYQKEAVVFYQKMANYEP